MLYDYLCAQRHHMRQLAVRLTLCAFHITLAMATPLPPASAAESAESFSTGIIPTGYQRRQDTSTPLLSLARTARWS